MTASAAAVYEAQRVCTSATAGQTLGGCLRLHLALTPEHTVHSQCFAHSSTARALQRELQQAFNQQDPLDPRKEPYARAPSVIASVNASLNGVASLSSAGSAFWLGVGQVAVQSYGVRDAQGGQCWDIRFPSHLGNLPLMTADVTKLTGLGAAAAVTPLTDGAALGGSWQLRLFGDTMAHSTPYLAYSVSAAELQAAITVLPGVVSAAVERSAPSAACSDGLCSDHTTAPTLTGLGGGFIWTIEVATTVGNVLPSWPADAATAALEGPVFWPYAVSKLTGPGASLQV